MLSGIGLVWGGFDVLGGGFFLNKTQPSAEHSPVIAYGGKQCVETWRAAFCPFPMALSLSALILIFPVEVWVLLSY